jgi:hypothetical protein
MPGLWFRNLWPDSESSSDIGLFGPVVDDDPVVLSGWGDW